MSCIFLLQPEARDSKWVCKVPRWLDKIKGNHILKTVLWSNLTVENPNLPHWWLLEEVGLISSDKSDSLSCQWDGPKIPLNFYALPLRTPNSSLIMRKISINPSRRRHDTWPIFLRYPRSFKTRKVWETVTTKCRLWRHQTGDITWNPGLEQKKGL